MTQTQKIFNQKEKGEKKRKTIGLRFDLVNKFLVCLIVVLGIGFVISINDLSIKGFVLQDLKIKSQELQVVKTETELVLTKLGSYETIEKRAQDLKMVKTDKIDYITVMEGAVAKK